jgi:phage anti-repressor protein
VDARELHASLQVKSEFNYWIRRRIEEYGFKEGEEFSSNLKKIGDGAGRSRIDYLITVDMAKELAMVERTEFGQRVRRYFIECEKELRNRSTNHPGLSKIENALVEVAREHDARISKLESTARPGEDWLSISEYLKKEWWSITLNGGHITQLSKRAMQVSAQNNTPLGTARTRHGHLVKTFSPVLLAKVIPPILERWEKKNLAVLAGKELF